jgi:hypothetical protein
MARLIIEVWKDGAEQTVCLAGPMGDDARKTMSPNAELIWRFEAESHFDAMTQYNAKMGRGKYTTEFAVDYEPYPDEWLRIQRGL